MDDKDNRMGEETPLAEEPKTDPTYDQPLDTVPQVYLDDSTADGHSGKDQLTIDGVIDIPWKYRIPAFCLILVWGTGASFADITIGPLKSTLIRELKINSAHTVKSSRD